MCRGFEIARATGHDYDEQRIIECGQPIEHVTVEAVGIVDEHKTWSFGLVEELD